MNSAIAAKAFIVEDSKLLMIKRRDDAPHEAGKWELPGGRLETGENPFEGIKREVKEETNLDIEILNPLGIHYFTRQDGQVITMIVFLCKRVNGEVKLSHEHTDFEWFDLEKAQTKIHEAHKQEFEFYKKIKG